MLNLSNGNREHRVNLSFNNSKHALIQTSKKREGKLWTHNVPNIYKAQLDYIFLKKNWINSSLNWEAYFSLEWISSEHRMVSANIQVSLRRNKKHTAKIINSSLHCIKVIFFIGNSLKWYWEVKLSTLTGSLLFC